MWIVTSVWTDCEYPLNGSIIGIGAAVIDNDGGSTFLGMASPISDNFDADILASYGMTREEHSTKPDPERVIKGFVDWVNTQRGSPEVPAVLISDRPFHDWMFICHYCAKFNLVNPFFHARSIGDIFSGIVRNMGAGNVWKRWGKRFPPADPREVAKTHRESIKAFADRAGLIIPRYTPKIVSPPYISSSPIRSEVRREISPTDLPETPDTGHTIPNLMLNPMDLQKLKVFTSMPDRMKYLTSTMARQDSANSPSGRALAASMTYSSVDTPESKACPLPEPFDIVYNFRNQISPSAGRRGRPTKAQAEAYAGIKKRERLRAQRAKQRANNNLRRKTKVKSES